jgi:CubicO group peptidase (beta-lactamase class C family)
MSQSWLTKSTGMFTGADQTQHFREMASIMPCRVIRRAPKPHRFHRGKPIQLPDAYSYDGKRRSTAELLATTETVGLLVLSGGSLRFEQYWVGVTRTTQWTLWSITKSWVSALIGIALAEGAIQSVDDPVVRYARKLSGSAFDGPTIRHVLQMSSGAHWDEAYWDAESDIREAGRALALGGSRTEVAMRLRREFEPGTYHRYSSIDTHVLGMVLRGATRRPLSEYLRDKLWHPLGAESDAFWVIEGDGREWAAAGLSATLRDVAKLGVLYAQEGFFGGRQLLPKAWVEASRTADAPHLTPGYREPSASPFGYGYQFWLPDSSGPYCAIGIYNQFIYIDPARELVIAKLSANRNYAAKGLLENFREAEHFAFFRAIARRC